MRVQNIYRTIQGWIKTGCKKKKKNKINLIPVLAKIRQVLMLNGDREWENDDSTNRSKRFVLNSRQ